MKNKGRSLSEPLMLKAQLSEKFSKSKNLRNFGLLGALEIRGYEKLRFLLQKAHSCVNQCRLSHFASNWLWGLTPRAEREKSQKVSDSHRNDVSPLTQGLRYRAACDVYTRFPLVPKPMTLSDPWPEFQGHGRQNWRFSAFKSPISRKRLKLRSCNFHRTVAPSL